MAALAARHLERLGIPYVVVGSVASALNGEPRATLDVDLTLRRDVLGVLKARGPELERDYLDDRALELGVADLLRKSLREAGLG